MDNFNIIFNKLNYEKNNNILAKIVKKLESIINDLISQKRIDMIINQIKYIIILMNKVIIENKENTDQLKIDIKNLNKNMLYKYKNINYINNNLNKSLEYKGEFKNYLRNEKGFSYNINDENEINKYLGEGDYDREERERGIIVNNGNIYEEEFNNNLKENDIEYYPNEDEYNGNLKDEINERKRLSYNNGINYDWEWKYLQRERIGIMNFPNGGQAIGYYLNDKAKGKFIYLKPNRWQNIKSDN